MAKRKLKGSGIMSEVIAKYTPYSKGFEKGYELGFEEGQKKERLRTKKEIENVFKQGNWKAFF
jgi:flagellar biosynthesis/type III secretory pathway protein FliH